MPPNISLRHYIQWPPAAPSEPTSTLVLTSSQRRFVDVRMLLSSTASNIDVQNASAVDWAFAGTSASTMAEGKTLSQWHHWVDSKTTKPEEVVDKGEMLPEGEDGLALEKGAMVNPATGVVAEYVEAWRDERAVGTDEVGDGEAEGFWGELEGRGVVVRGLGALGDGQAGVSVVLRHENPGLGSRGMVVRVGKYCQGVMRVGEKFGLERWEWSGSHGGWERKYVVGDLSIPCEVLNVLGGRIGQETTVTYGDGEDLVWECIEAELF